MTTCENVVNVTPIVTESVQQEIRSFITKFSLNYSNQPPEFTDKRRWYYVRDLYERDIIDTNPIRTDWFYSLLVNATKNDLDAIVTAYSVEKYSGFAFCLMRCLQQNLIEQASELDKTGIPVSRAIPEWFRNAGWNVPKKWNCEF
jgi:hypothetical protein